MDGVEDQSLFLSKAWRPDFAPNGSRIQVGDLMTRKRYADFLCLVRDKGAQAFYSGKLAKQIVSAVQGSGGILTLKDLQDYRVKSRPTVDLKFGQYRLVTSGAPSGGIVGLNILNTFQGYSRTDDHASINLTTHRLDEAFRFGYGAVCCASSVMIDMPPC
jgi:gamma-glutamyltranspeptidase/glutathione hydrolase